MGAYDLVVDSESDWTSFARHGLETVVDPMVFRSADVFLRGEKEAAKSLDTPPESLWGALSANVGSLTAFFDALVLSECLPIIDYGQTFDNQLGYEVQPLRDRVNQAAGRGLLNAVHVMGEASESARAAALESLVGVRGVGEGVRDDIVKELSAFDHSWEPNVEALRPRSPADRRLLQFAYGGRLFAEYASRAEAAHLLQPKRSRLFLDLAIGNDAQNEDALFEVLRSRLAEHNERDAAIVDIEGLPSFLPYLLDREPSSVAALLDDALDLRSKGSVRDYRKWRVGLLQGWRERKHIDRQIERDLKRAARDLAKEFEPRNMPNVEVKLTLAGVVGGVALPVQRLFGWASAKLPGKRHTMLLMRMAASSQEYETLDDHLKSLWRS